MTTTRTDTDNLPDAADLARDMIDFQAEMARERNARPYVETYLPCPHGPGNALCGICPPF
jgi:hypothetical protein